MDAMIVLTTKKDKGTQDVQGFYPGNEYGLKAAMRDATAFLADSFDSKRAIVRVELYNPPGADEPK